MVTGRGLRGSAIAVSSGLLSAAPPAELEGVLAHELWHIRSRDVIAQTSVVVLASALIELSRIGGWFERPLLFVLGPVAGALVSSSSRPSASSWRTAPRLACAARPMASRMH